MKEISYYKEPEPVVTETPGLVAKERSRGSAIAPTMRTYTQDVAQLVEREGVTKTKVVMAESARKAARGEAPELPSHGSHLGKIIFVLVLVLAFGIGVGIYVLIGSKTALTVTSEKTPPHTLVRATTIALSGLSREDILADITILAQKIATGGNDEIVGITVTEEGSEGRDATMQEVLSAFAAQKPDDTLLRALKPDVEFGMRKSSAGVAGYLYGSVRSYESAYAGLLAWEKNMAADLMPALGPEFPRKSLSELRDRQFKDERFGKADARTLRSPDGKLLLGYAVVGRQTVIISGGEVALRSLIERATESGQPR